MEVHIIRVTEGDIANIVSGYVIISSMKLPFKAIAYGRIGGQNIMPKISASTKARLKRLSIALDAFLDTLQMKLMEGDMTLHTPPQPPEVRVEDPLEASRLGESGDPS